MRPNPKKVSIAKFKVKRAIAPTKKRRYKCVGGPYNGKYIVLLTPKTYTFSVKEFLGYYSAIASTNKFIYWTSLRG